MKPSGLKRFAESRRSALVCLLLAAVTAVVYWQVSGFEFTNYDDPTVILKNPHVLGGMTWAGLRWALTTSWHDYWHPLPWLTHMLDCELFGLDAGWHHLVNLGYHVANTLLLFAVLRRMTGAPGRSAMVAALFALHPLHIQSVAWITERKDVLSAFFFFLTLWAYARYAESGTEKAESSIQHPPSSIQSHASRITHHAYILYLLSLFFFACGLMSKPMLVTLPFVLLLLDYWPLGRMQNAECRMQNHASRFTFHVSRSAFLPLVVEKLPFFALTLGSCAIIWLHVSAGKDMASPDAVPWGLRLANAPVSYVRYLWKMIWPVDLAVLYPMPDQWAWWQVGGAVAVLLFCTLLALAPIRRQPWLAVGWFWFLGMLVPAIALVPVWHISMADRFTYLPLIGTFIALVWGGFELLRILRTPRTVGWAVAGVIVLACGGASWVQLRYWRNSAALWARALAVTIRNARAHLNYGVALDQQGRLPEALKQYQAAVRIEPDIYEIQNNLGRMLYRSGQLHEATNHLMQAIRLDPGNCVAQANLGGALAALGDWSGAQEHYEAAMAADPQNAAIPSDWGKALLAHNRSKEALECFARALQIDPRWTEARLGYGFALAEMGAALAAEGKLEEAAQHYRNALQLQPDLPEVLNNLAWLLATANDARLRNGAEAVQLAKRACELAHYQQALLVGTLAAAYAEAGQFEAARDTAQKAIALAEAAGQTELAARNRELLHLYEAGKPCRQ